jgi:hypothetical protein
MPLRCCTQDELYQQQTLDACSDVARHLLGAYGALRHARWGGAHADRPGPPLLPLPAADRPLPPVPRREVKLLASLLYHGLTTGAGATTLGEEYCDVLQTAASGQPPSAGQRLLLVLLQSLGPYLAGRAAAGVERGTATEPAQQHAFEEPDAGHR